MRQETITLYQFDELPTDAAKERARSWYREGMDTSDYAEFVLSDAAEIAALLGIELSTRTRPTYNGGTRQEPVIYRSGFSSQGDGASYTGSYYYKKGCAKAVRKFTGNSDNEHAKRLYAIADGLTAIQKTAGYKLQAIITQHSSHYCHEMTMVVDVERDGGADCTDAQADAVTELLRDFARYIYHQLEAEYDYQNADAQIDETIRANEYEFNEDGSRA